MSALNPVLTRPVLNQSCAWQVFEKPFDRPAVLNYSGTLAADHLVETQQFYGPLLPLLLDTEAIYFSSDARAAGIREVHPAYKKNNSNLGWRNCPCNTRGIGIGGSQRCYAAKGGRLASGTCNSCGGKPGCGCHRHVVSTSDAGYPPAYPPKPRIVIA